MKKLPIVIDLPTPIAREIGRIIAAHSTLEQYLTRVIYMILGVGPKDGRLAVREPRTEDRLDLILDLQEVELTKTDILLLRDSLTAAKRERDKVAHGVWLKEPDDGRLFIRFTKGKWPMRKDLGKRVKRIIRPEGQEIHDKDL